MIRLSLCLPFLLGGLVAAEPADASPLAPATTAASDEAAAWCGAGRHAQQGFGFGRSAQPGVAPDRQQRRAQRFAQLDADGSGGVSLAEFLAAEPPAQRRGRGQGRCRVGGGAGAAAGDRWARHQAQLRQVFPSVDADASGELELAEFAHVPTAMRQARFASLDADGDGRLSQAEFLADAPGSGPGARRGRGPDPQRIFGFIDRDADGQISAAEWAAHRPGPHHGRGGRCRRSPAGDG